MNRLIAAAAVLLLGTTARADMGMPGDRYVPVRITLTVDPLPPGVVLFIQDIGPIRRMPTTPTIRIESPPGTHGAGFRIYAVPESVVASWPEGMPPRYDWFGYPERPECRLVGVGGAKGRVPFNDNRATIDQEYRLFRNGDDVRVVKVYENEVNRLYSGVVGYGTCCGLPVALLTLVGWGLGRLVSRRSDVSGGKQLPPPSAPGVTPT